MLEKEVAYIQLSKEYRGFVSHTLISFLGPSSANRISHRLTIEWYIDMHTDDAGVVSHFVMDRRQILCGSEPPHQLSGSTLDEAMEAVGDVVNELTSNAFRIIESGPYWYNFKLERDWTPADSGIGWRIYDDVDQRED